MSQSNWENVYLFISSTFNDMHAERDYLVKRVFPELRMWCSQRRLKLIDIDLRWGVSEEDATENKRVIDVCMNNIDKCRPFFLSFLGQRRGWVPGFDDINENTLQQYPNLKDHLGKHSITELEIIHALMNPLDNHSQKTEHAFFYFRDDSYLKQIQDEEIRHLYQPIKKDTAFEDFKKMIQDCYPVGHYECLWNPEKSTSELINVGGKDLSKGRLEQFNVQGESLKQSILNHLKSAIEKEFPERENIDDFKSALQHELFQQDMFLFHACESYIPRVEEEQKLLDYVHGDECVPFVLKANAGSGKTSLIAHLLNEKKLRGKVFYRFAGISIDSSNTERTLGLIAEEMKEAGVISEKDEQEAAENILLNFSSLLMKVKEEITLVIDALDQWDKAAEDMYWLPPTLPEHVKVVLSVRSDSDQQLLSSLTARGVKMALLNNMESREEKIQFIQQYMSQFLKSMNDEQVEMILQMEGTGNPLYLKIVLNELRIYGSFDTLVHQLKTKYGKTPSDAFEKLMERLEEENYSTTIENHVLVCVFLGTLAYSLGGMNLKEYAELFGQIEDGYESQDIMDGIYELARHLNPYLKIDGDHVDFLYDSFRKAVQHRYRSMEETFHLLLFKTYFMQYADKNDFYAVNDAMRTLLIKLTHHGIGHSEEMFRALFMEQSYFYPAVQNMKTSLLYQYLMKAQDKGYGTEFQEIAYALQKEALAVDTNARVVFEALKKLTDNEIAQSLVESAKEELNLSYYAPVYEKTDESKPYREFSFFETSRGTKTGIVKDYVLYVTNCVLWKKDPDATSILYLQNIHTEKIVSTLQLPYQVRRFNLHENMIYLVSAPVTSHDDVLMEIYEIPTLRRIMSKKVNLKLNETSSFVTFAHGYDGVMYDIVQTDDLPMREIVYRINDMTPLFEIEYPIEKTTFLSDGRIDKTVMTLNFYGPILLESNSNLEIVRLWYLPSGECLYEGAYDFSGCNCTMDQNVVYYYQKIAQGIMCEKYTVDHGRIIDRKRIELPDFKVKWKLNAEAACGHFFLNDGADTVCVYDSAFNFKGYLENIFTVSESIYNPKLFGLNQDLLIMNDQRCSLYHMDKILSCCTFDKTVSKAQNYSYPYTKFVYKNHLYLLADDAKRIDTRTLKVTAESTMDGFCEDAMAKNTGNTSSDVYEIKGEDYLLRYQKVSYKTGKYEFRLHKLNDFSISARIYKEFGDKIVESVFLHNFNLGIVLRSNETDKLFTPEIMIYSLYDFSEVKHTYLDVRCEHVHSVTLDYRKNYLMCLGCVEDDEHRSLQIYDSWTQTRMTSYVYHHEVYFNTSSMYIREDRLYLLGQDKRKKETFILNYDFGLDELFIGLRLNMETDYEQFRIREVTEDEMFIADFVNYKFYIYALPSFEKKLEIIVEDRSNPFKTLRNTKMMHRNGMIISVLRNGRMDMYSDQTGKLIMSQFLPYEDNDIVDFEGERYFYVGCGMKQYLFYELRNTKQL